jgi:hypothetical protein
MEKTHISYIKTDDNKILNEKCIRWVKKMGECLEVCTIQTGYTVGINTHQICKLNQFDSFTKLNKHFE